MELEYNPSRFATVEDYRLTLKETKNLLEKASGEEEDIIKGIISDLEYTIEWMKSGRRPGNKRGIERRAAYQRERPMDPLIIQRYFRSTNEGIYKWDNHVEEDVISISDRLRIDQALTVLTEKEKEIYLMSRGHCLSYSQIARYLCVSRSSVQSTIERAENKLCSSLFSFC
jgi:RNA polymerase sigma-70 factor (ECF subfamily)